MKKIKTTAIFVTVILALTVLFCLNVGAINYDERTGEIEYKFDEDTAVMTIKGTGGTIRSGAFGPGVSSNPQILEWNIEDTDSLKGEYEDGDNVEFWDYEPNAIAASAAQAARIVIVDGSVTALEPGCFSHFKNAEIIVLPDTIKTIPTATFYSLENLKTVVLSYQTTTIGSYAFSGCKNLKTINISNTVKSIGKYAFWDCDLDYVIIPDTVESLAEGNSYIPDNLSGVEAALVEHDRIWVKWEELPNQLRYTYYRVFMRVDGKWKTLGNCDIFDNAIFEIKELEPDTSYTFAVRPYNKVNGKNYFAEKYVKITVRTAPDMPALKVASTKSGTASFTWNNVSGETGYQIWYSTKEYGTYTKISNYKANAVSASKSGLTGGKTYYFKIRSYKSTTDGYVYSRYSSPVEVKIATATGPATPVLKVTSTKAGTASFTWNDVSGETGYQIWYSTSENGGYTKISNYKANTVSASESGLKGGSTYYFKIRAYKKTDDGYVYSSYSNPVKMKIK